MAINFGHVPLALLPHRISAEPYLGDGSEGPTFGPPVSNIPARVEGRIDVTADGQHTGSVKVYARLDRAHLLADGSRVTLPGGGIGRVQAFARHDDGGLGAWGHIEVTVQGKGAS